MKVQNVSETLDSMSIQLNLEKCEFAQRDAEWLRIHLSQTDIKPFSSKVQGVTDRLKPKNLKELRSFLRTVNQMIRVNPNLAQLCLCFRLLLKTETN